MNEPIPRWWFYLYNLMEQFLQENGITEQELIETIQKFITQSNIAEFENRLNLLYVFHCHATYLEETKRRSK